MMILTLMKNTAYLITISWSIDSGKQTYVGKNQAILPMINTERNQSQAEKQILVHSTITQFVSAFDFQYY